MKNKFFSRFSLLLCVVLFAAMTLLAGCGDKQSSNPSSEATSYLEGGVIGEGNSQFIFEVYDETGTKTEFTVHTDEATVGAALIKLELIAGDVGEYGLYVKTVNGKTFDYDTDKKYWAFYIDGEYAMTGIDMTEIEQGKTYAMKVE